MSVSIPSHPGESMIGRERDPRRPQAFILLFVALNSRSLCIPPVGDNMSRGGVAALSDCQGGGAEGLHELVSQYFNCIHKSELFSASLNRQFRSECKKKKNSESKGFFISRLLLLGFGDNADMKKMFLRRHVFGSF